MTNIAPEIAEILRNCVYEGGLLKLPSQLPRNQYVAVNKVLEALGGEWSRKWKGHVFDGDAKTIITTAIDAGKYCDAKKEDDFYETPEPLATRLINLAGVQEGDLVLEPSAGKGVIVGLLKAAGADVVAVETNVAYYNDLLKLDVESIFTCDFLTLIPSCRKFNCVVMNPPFGRNGTQADIDHVRHAWKFLKVGGRLVSVMSNGWTFRTNKKSLDFKRWVVRHRGKCGKNAEGAFKSSGTMTKTVTLVLTKTDRPRLRKEKVND